MRVGAVVTRVVAVVAVVVAGTGATAAPLPPPTGNDFYYPGEMLRGLLSVADLPTGYTQAETYAGQADQLDRLDGRACFTEWGESVQRGDNGAPITYASRTFTHPDGSGLVLGLYALGTGPVAEWITDTASPPGTCPRVVTEDGITVEHRRLPLPGVTGSAAGLTSVSRHGQAPAEYRHSAAVAWNSVVLTLEETKAPESGEARFAGIVETAARQVAKIGAGPTMEEFRQAQLTVAELPAGFRLVTDDTVQGRTVFTEQKCEGGIWQFGDERPAARRVFAKGAATVTVVVGAAERGLGGVMDERIGACPTLTGPGGVERTVAAPERLPSIWGAGGIIYQDEPPVLRGIAEVVDIVSDVRVTMTDGVDQAAAEKVREAALDAVWHFYHADAETEESRKS
ncbi:hypothetical protein [Actinoplanes philippinensis]|uniref:hypothetical protein n=1 Tax=Actinoplanes philippinensis TaxID=35752 RepID=UPI0033D0B512